MAFYVMHFLLGNFSLFCKKFLPSGWKVVLSFSKECYSRETKVGDSCYYLVQPALMAQILFQLFQLPFGTYPFMLSFKAILGLLPSFFV
jgi:hypothetical protein